MLGANDKLVTVIQIPAQLRQTILGISSCIFFPYLIVNCILKMFRFAGVGIRIVFVNHFEIILCFKLLILSSKSQSRDI